MSVWLFAAVAATAFTTALRARIFFEHLAEVGVFTSRGFQIEEEVLDGQPQVIERVLQAGYRLLELVGSVGRLGRGSDLRGVRRHPDGLQQLADAFFQASLVHWFPPICLEFSFL